MVMILNIATMNVPNLLSIEPHQMRSLPLSLGRIKRKAFTLVELLLTTSLLIALTLVVTPAIATLWQNHLLSRAVNEVRIAISRARIQAIESNTILCFRCKVGGHHFEVIAMQSDGLNFVPREGHSLPGVTYPSNISGDIGEEFEFCLPHVDSRSFEKIMYTVWIFPDGTLRGDDLRIIDSVGKFRNLEFHSITGAIHVE